MKLHLTIISVSLWCSAMSQTITSVTPGTAYQGQSIQLSISGTDLIFVEGTNTSVWLENGSVQINAYSESAQGTYIHSLTVPLDAPLGMYDVHVGTGTVSLAHLSNAVEVLAALPTPMAPELIAPAQNAQLTTSPVSLQWSDLPDISNYHFQLGLSSDMSLIYSNQINVPQSSYSASLPTGTYYWRVRARNLSGLWSEWSIVRSFGVSGTGHLTSMTPNSGHAGQNNLFVSISGVTLPFSNASSVTETVLLQQNAFQMAMSNADIYSPNNGNANLNIPLNTPTGYYSLIYDHLWFDPIELYNAFYVTSGNEYSGRVFIDQNQNQVFDSGDIPYPYAMVNASPGSVHTLSQTDGTYLVNLPSGTYSVTLGDLNYFTPTPSQHSVTFAGSGETDAANDFALQPIAGFHDVSLVLTIGIPPRPGLEMTLHATVKNVGPSTESGQFSIIIPSGLNIVSSSNPNYTIVGNTATWNFGPIQPLGTVMTTVTLSVPLSAQLGDVLSFVGQASISSTDADPSNNQFTRQTTVVNSYDPNYKEVAPAEFISPEMLSNGEYLDYTIHFQNLGTADALDIYILDTMSAHLDLGSLQVLSASHENVVRILDHRLVEFRFDDINLPDSASNEPESHGFINYRIRPSASFGIGDVIRNTAYIYFDFNVPVITNTTENLIPTGVSNDEETPWLSVGHEVTTGRYIITCTGRYTCSLFDMSGALILSRVFTDRCELDMSDRPAGIYLIKVEDGARISSRKVVVH